MRVDEYRDLVDQMLRVVDDWHACADAHERAIWSQQAEAIRVALTEAQCARASDRDRERRQLALQRYTELIRPEPSTSAFTSNKSTSSSATRAAKYNKSAARAVRLSRAARSAMRRGYF